MIELKLFKHPIHNATTVVARRRRMSARRREKSVIVAEIGFLQGDLSALSPEARADVEKALMREARLATRLEAVEPRYARRKRNRMIMSALRRASGRRARAKYGGGTRSR